MRDINITDFFRFQKPSCASKEFMENINKWSLKFEETDPLMRFEQMNVDQVCFTAFSICFDLCHQRVFWDQIYSIILQPQQKETDVINMSVNYSKAWNTRRLSILHKYTTGEKLTIVSSYLPGGERGTYIVNYWIKHSMNILFSICLLLLTNGFVFPFYLVPHF